MTNSQTIQAVSSVDRKGPGRPIAQYSVGKTLSVWAAAALPMAALSWWIAPRLAGLIEGPEPFFQALWICMTVGLVWQFLLVIGLVWHEQRSLRWSVVREALWLRSPRSPKTGRTDRRIWLVLIPLAVFFYAERMIPTFDAPASRELGLFLGSDAGQAFFDGSWIWFGLVVLGVIFNTVLGEELLFRGLLLPRMNGAFGKADWVVNGLLFGGYHLHVPWVIPTALVDALVLAYPSKRYRSAWIGIAVHSAQSVFILAMVLGLVL
jgi:membrane protease YdiL (CAAX protease family)